LSVGWRGFTTEGLFEILKFGDGVLGFVDFYHFWGLNM
jgi:hypothetical protein